MVVTHPNLPEDNATLFRLLGHIFFSVDEAALKLTRQLADALSIAREVGTTMPIRSRAIRDLERPVDDRLARHLCQRDACHSRLENAAATSRETLSEVPLTDSVWHDAERIFLSSEPYSFGEEHVTALREGAKLTQPIELIDGEMVSWYGVRAIAGAALLG